MWTNYVQAVSTDEVLALLAQHRERARIINGGTDLLVEIERKLRAPQLLIDASRIPGLDTIHIDGHTVRLGAGVTHNQVVADPRLRERAFALVRACWELGAPQIRNRATLAGNLVTASPANDTISPLWALGARVTLRSLRGERVLALPDFFKGVRRTAIEPDEMLTEIVFPLPSVDTRSTFLKLGLRRAQAISVVHVAVVVEFEAQSARSDSQRPVRSAQIALGSVSPTIIPATEAQDYLAGKNLADASIAEAARLAMDAARPIDDIRGTADYRRAMVGVYVARALRQLRAGNERDTFPQRPVMLWGFPGLSKPPIPNSHVDPSQSIDVVVNGKRYHVAGGHQKSLLRFLREDLGLTGTKEGCTEGECGACTVFLDGVAVMSCLVPAPRAHGTSVTTVEGLGAKGALHSVQQGLIAEGGVQCGYCTPGFVMSGVKLLEEVPNPTRSDIQQAFTGNLCRCTGYAKILKAMQTASQQSA
jgi:xanthine dehydrogenase iron-sulfur cluster and FAD-binding subunit A